MPKIKYMRKFTILFSISIGTFVYVLVSLFCGQNGLWAESQLVKQKMNLCTNISNIQKINDELSLEHTALLKDSEVISAHARRLGFVMEGEHLVKISGIPPKTQKAYSVGKFYKIEEIQFVPEHICKILGICVSFLTFFIAFLISLGEKKSANEKTNTKVINNLVEVSSGNL